MLGRLAQGSGLCATRISSSSTCRGIANIPAHEYHIRMDQKVGRKRPNQDVLDRFKRLNNGMWIRAVPGKNKLRYMKDETWQTTSMYYETCTKDQCEMLDKLVTPYWLRPKHYPNDPYEAYHVRHGISSPRVNDKGNFVRERRKVLLDDSTASRYFSDC
ncbi:unnamed protein product [Caenorhabditis bovis]|uniref:39S ribosomal protein L35, mitochondrial n=1 Tax=Caenorhabditis bovis TaxID=2654633 RepID=A0A8S1EST7_9PELO|nr:unnamed protein product [Caenorhabditis bovis]